MYFETEMAVQGHPSSLILAPIESAYTKHFLSTLLYGAVLERYSSCVGIVSFAYRAVNNPIKQLNKILSIICLRLIAYCN